MGGDGVFCLPTNRMILTLYNCCHMIQLFPELGQLLSQPKMRSEHQESLALKAN